MGERFVSGDRETPRLLPPDPGTEEIGAGRGGPDGLSYSRPVQGLKSGLDPSYATRKELIELTCLTLF